MICYCCGSSHSVESNIIVDAGFAARWNTHCDIADVPIQRLLTNNTMLRRTRFVMCGLTRHGVNKMVKGLGKNTTIGHIDLSNNNICQGSSRAALNPGFDKRSHHAPLTRDGELKPEALNKRNRHKHV